MEKLKFRLELLKNGNVIDEEIHDKVLNLLEYLKNDWEIILNEDNGAMFITHLSMALKRIKEGENVNRIDENVYEEVLKSEELEKIENIYDGMIKNIFFEEMPEEEKKYIYVNLLLIMENLKK